MNEITLRLANIQELERLLAWRKIVLKEVFPDCTEEKLNAVIEENRLYYLRTLPKREHIACFACCGEEIIGCGGLCLYSEMPSPDNPNGKCGYLMNIYVLQKYRQNGTGKKIVEYLVGQARQQDAGKIYLEAATGTVPFYKSAGFSDMRGYMKL